MSFRSFPKSADVARPGPPALIVIGTDWCGFCQQFKPELKAMERQLTCKIYWVDGDSDPRAKAWKVDGYPTVMYHPSAGGLYRFDGQRTLNGIRKFIDSLEAS